MPAKIVAHTISAARLWDRGKSYKSRGVKRVADGSIRTCSQPRKRNTGQRRSANCAAAMSQASEVRGASGLDANPTAKWPMNMPELRPKNTGWAADRGRFFERDADHRQSIKPGSTLPDHQGAVGHERPMQMWNTAGDALVFLPQVRARRHS